MITKVKTFATLGLQGHEIIVEGDTNNALPSIEIIGLPDAAIRESKERLRATFRNVGIQLPRRKFVLNLSPSDIRKVGTSFDLAMAVAILLIIQ
jgi:magnesium chelatase family protein